MNPSPGQPAAAPPRWKRTLFIVLDSGVAIRNILRTDVLRVLRADSGLRVVVFTPLVDADFQRELGADNIAFEKMPRQRTGWCASIVQSLENDVWAAKTGVFTFNVGRRRRLRGRLLGWALRNLLRVQTPGRGEALLRRLGRWRAACTPPLGCEFFDRYQPDLVFFTTGFSRRQVIERGAVQRGIRTAAFIMSWDNLTSKGPLRIRADRVIVWNEFMHEEVVRHHGYPPEHVFVSGIPQFDIYHDRAGYATRAQFFQRMQLDPARKLIVYTTGTPGTAPFDHEVVDLLHQSIQRGEFRQPCQLLVRLHPKDRYDDYRRFERQPGLVLQLPGRRSRHTDDSWNPTHEDMYGLAETMCYADVVVNVASTITIDAAAFDKPVVNIAYDGYTTKPYLQSALRYYDYDHYRRIVQSGGVRIARSNAETIEHVQAYLDDPTLEAAGRALIRTSQCWKLDGQSGRRIGQYLLDLLYGPGPG
jgi:hypothetical protein